MFWQIRGPRTGFRILPMISSAAAYSLASIAVGVRDEQQHGDRLANQLHVLELKRLPLEL
jgi:hypothetical protein